VGTVGSGAQHQVGWCVTTRVWELLLGREQAAGSLIVCLQVGLRTCQASGVQRVSRKPNIRLTKRQQSTATCPNCSGKSCRHISNASNIKVIGRRDGPAMGLCSRCRQCGWGAIWPLIHFLR
jgi:hypothetical protein